jgi:hypothetical protein
MSWAEFTINADLHCADGNLLLAANVRQAWRWDLETDASQGRLQTNTYFMSVFAFLQRLRIQLTDDQRYLEVDYRPGTHDALYDICDTNGRIIKTGKMNGNRIKIAVSDLISSAYVLLVLDGENIRSRRFTIER